MSGTMKDSVRETITAIITNITNFNSKRMVVTILFLVLSYKIVMFSVPVGFKPLIDPTIIYGGMAAALAYWMKKESESPTYLETGEKTNGYAKKTTTETNTTTTESDDSSKAFGKVNDKESRPTG